MTVSSMRMLLLVVMGLMPVAVAHGAPAPVPVDLKKQSVDLARRSPAVAIAEISG